MEYLAVAVALAALSVKGYYGKRMSNCAKSLGDAFFFNLLRMLLCAMIGIALVFVGKAAGELQVEPMMLGICFISGLSNAMFLVTWLLAIRKNAMVTIDVGLMMGSLLPAILCALLFDEAMRISKMLGFGLILIAAFVLAGYSKKTVGKGGFSAIVLMLFTVLGDSFCGFSQQLYKQFYTEAGTKTHGVLYSNSIFHFYTYVFAAAALASVLLGYRIRTKVKAPKGEEAPRLSFSLPILLMIGMMAICLFVGNYMQTVATNDFGMSSQMLYPIIKGGCLVTVNFTAMIFFGEPITRRSVLGSLLALSGIVCMSIL